MKKFLVDIVTGKSFRVRTLFAVSLTKSDQSSSQPGRGTIKLEKPGVPIL